MKLELDKLWKKISSEKTKSRLILGEYKATPTKLKTKEGELICVAIDTPTNKRHLLIPTPDLDFKNDTYSKGVHVVGITLERNNQPLYFIDIVCQLTHLEDLMDILIDEIMDELEKDINDPYKTSKLVIEKWRELIGKTRSHVLSDEALQGLYGELWYLRELMDIDHNAVDCWIGPLGKPHDFEKGNRALEIKTTATKGWVFRINGIEQLTPPKGGELFFCTMKLDSIEDRSESVPEIVESIRNKGVDYTQLMNLLAEVGYYIVDEKHYVQRKYEIQEHRVYKVDKDFPKLTYASFKGDKLPPNIIDVYYILDLNTEPPKPITDAETKKMLQDFCL